MIYLVTNQTSLYSSNSYTYINVEEAINLLSAGFSELGIDTETQGLDCYTKKLLLLQIGNQDFQIVFDIESFGYRIPKDLVTFLNTYKGIYILQNAKFDLKFLFIQGVILKSVFDTMLAETILTNGLQYDGRDLDSLTQKYCGVSLDKSIRGEIITTGLSDRVISYGAKDVEYLTIIKRKQIAEAESVNLLNAVALDNAFVVVLAYVEFCGIKLDLPKWLEKTKVNKEKLLELKIGLEETLWRDQKYSFFSGMTDLWTGKQECILNWNSPKQVIKLFNDYGINTTVKEKGESKDSIDAKILEPQVKKFPILVDYLKYKEFQKEVSTYGDNWKNYINPITGRVHTTFKQLMDTSRLSSGDKNDKTPNMQNLPSDKLTRSCFIVEKGNSMTSADYKSQEQIVLANFSKEENLINFYKKGFSDMNSMSLIREI